MKPDNRPFRKNPGIFPAELAGMTSLCQKCNHTNEIDWVGDLTHPKEPIQGLDKSGYWVPVSFPVTCSNCEAETQFHIPIIEAECPWDLYGDEAGRIVEINGKEISFFCISMVALHVTKHKFAERKLRNLKLVARPNHPPEQWTHHFTKIWSDNGNDRQFDFAGIKDKIKYGQRYAALINSLKPHLITFNFSSAIILHANKKERAAQLKHQKQEIFKQTLLTTLSVMRNNKKSALWTFDNIKDTSNGEKNEGWADECFLGLQYTRLFTYLAGGNTITAPKFVSPGSHYLLEVADFISFCMAREFQRLSEGKDAELPSGLMGNMINQMVDVNNVPFWKYENGSISIRRYFINKTLRNLRTSFQMC